MEKLDTIITIINWNFVITVAFIILGIWAILYTMDTNKKVLIAKIDELERRQKEEKPEATALLPDVSHLRELLIAYDLSNLSIDKTHLMPRKGAENRADKFISNL